MSNYKRYRGKCKEMSEELVASDPTLRLVRGFYYEPAWGREEQHWWCVRADGAIVDPTKLQFPSAGVKEYYREFDGTVACEECGVSVKEEDIVPMGNYPTCSGICAMKLVGVA